MNKLPAQQPIFAPADAPASAEWHVVAQEAAAKVVRLRLRVDRQATKLSAYRERYKQLAGCAGQELRLLQSELRAAEIQRDADRVRIFPKQPRTACRSHKLAMPPVLLIMQRLWGMCRDLVACFAQQLESPVYIYLHRWTQDCIRVLPCRRRSSG